ncbi:hypothetical protein NM208_g4114 [Fusarium decemcellulare]|uniref:Uncharacterized protein n=1 Tax=Fusarium decemcellulare TaxID=57161 RepID=A0ACC1SM55_9HYPO|nr:hypothetical protein NM208_g4114 [Fusarium decemcellulare]
MVTAKAYGWCDIPGVAKYTDLANPPYHIQQLHDPLAWTEKLGLERPEGWNADYPGMLGSLDDLYRWRYSSSKTQDWHHWVYASAQEDPLQGKVDPWDRAFDELLRHEDEHGRRGRGDFHYVTCPQSFLCHTWHITGPALLHFTTEKPPQGDRSNQGSKNHLTMQDHDPVTVRLFELPLHERVIPGAFPSYFEQMRSITDCKSSFWATKQPYMEWQQLIVQAERLYDRLEETYPRTYGTLAKVERKWKQWQLDGGLVNTASRLISTTITTIPTVYGIKWYAYISNRWNRLRHGDSKTDNDFSQRPAQKDPVASALQRFLDSMSEEDKKEWMRMEEGQKVLERMQTDLDTKEWNSRDEIMKEISGVVGSGRDRKTEERH